MDRHYFRTGGVERPQRDSAGRPSYAWRSGYSLILEGGATYPWVTKTEAQQAAGRAGCRAIFHDTEAAAVTADLAQRMTHHDHSNG
jgi:hypothetical protein